MKTHRVLFSIVGFVLAHFITSFRGSQWFATSRDKACSVSRREIETFHAVRYALAHMTWRGFQTQIVSYCFQSIRSDECSPLCRVPCYWRSYKLSASALERTNERRFIRITGPCPWRSSISKLCLRNNVRCFHALINGICDCDSGNFPASRRAALVGDGMSRCQTGADIQSRSCVTNCRWLTQSAVLQFAV